MNGSERPSDPRERQQQWQRKQQQKTPPAQSGDNGKVDGGRPGGAGAEQEETLSLRDLHRLVRSLEEGLAQAAEDLAGAVADYKVLAEALRNLKTGKGGDIDYDPMLPKRERPTEADRRAAMSHAFAGIRSVHILWNLEGKVIVTMDELPPVTMSNKLADLLIALCRGDGRDGPFRSEWFSAQDLAPRVGYDVSKFNDRMGDTVANLILRLRNALPNRYLIRTDDCGRYRLLWRQGGQITIVKRPEAAGGD